MKLIWHIVLKDLRRLRLPLLFWVLLMAGRLVVYAIISGFIGPGNPEWLDYMRQGPTLLLRLTLDPVIVFILVGWLGYEDPLAARDAFWITRPISGGRLLAAKLLGAGLMFGLLPVLVNLPWWIACSLRFNQIAWAALLIAAPLLAVAVIGLTMAALTDGFPRYLLWSLVSLAVVGVVQLGLDLSMSINLPQAGQLFSQLGLALAGVIVVSLIILGYQYLTRRQARAVAMLAIGLVTIRVSINFSTGDLTEGFVARAMRPHVGPDQSGDERIRLSVAGAASYYPPGGGLKIPLLVQGLPDNCELSFRARCDWSWNGTQVWAAHGYGGGPSIQDLLRRMLKLPGYTADVAIGLYGMKIPKTLADRTTHEPVAFHADTEVYLLRCSIAADLPLNEQRVRNESGSYSLSQVWPKKDLLSLDISERSGRMLEGGYDLLTGRRGYGHYVLINRADGRVIDGHFDRGSDGPLGLVAVGIAHWTFASPAGPEWFKNAELVLVEYQGERVIARTIETNEFRLVEELPARSKRKK